LTQLRAGLLPIELRGDDSVRPVCFLPSGSIAAGDETGVLRCWVEDSQQPEQLWALESVLDLNTVAISARANVVLTAGARVARGSEPDGRARLADIDTRQFEVLKPFDAGVYAVAVSDDGAMLALGGDRASEIVLIDRVEGRRVSLPVEEGVACLALSADARWLAAGVGDAVHLWDLSSDSARTPIDTPSSVLALAFDPHAEHLAASVAGGVVCLWDLRDDVPLPIGQRTLGGLVNHLAWQHDGAAFIASGISNWQGMVLTCRLDEAPEAWVMLDLGVAERATTRTAVDVSADGLRLVAAGDGTNVARVFDLGNPEATPRDLRGHDQHVRDVAITNDGRCVAVSSEDSTIHLWDLDQSEPVVLSVVNGSAGRVVFRGNQLLAISESGLHRWNLDLDAVIALAGTSASRNLTPDEWNRFLFGTPQATFPDLDLRVSVD
jgi:WD40 repeat protein